MNRFILMLLGILLAISPIVAQAKQGRSTYPVELSASEGGKITPVRRTVHHGAKNVRFSIKPDKGFAVADVSINGTSRGAVSTLTVPVVTGPLNIVALFVPGTPSVDAGEDMTAFAGEPIALQPTVLPAVAGDPLEYLWKIDEKPFGGKAVFSDRRALAPTFLANRPGIYELKLRVTEKTNSAMDTVRVLVLPSPLTNPPIAKVTGVSSASVGQQVILNGSGSYDPSKLPLTYEWQLISRPDGSSATLSDASSIMADFTGDMPGSYVVKLTVSNEYASSEPTYLLIRVIQNVAPVADAGPDQKVAPGSVVTLDGSASNDADGDQLAFTWSFESCPQGICPQLLNDSTATPSFTADLTGEYTLNLMVEDGNVQSARDTVRITSAIAPPSSPDLLKMQWQYGIMGTNIGEAGLHVTDLDVDGFPEIVASASTGGFGSNSLWYILRQNSDGTYGQVWRSESFSSELVKLRVADVTGDGKNDVVSALADGTIRIYDGPTLKETAPISTAGTLADMAIADVDGDGKPEIITSNGTNIFVYAVENGELKWSATGGGTSIAVGNVDSDTSQEIVTTSSNGIGYVIDADSRTIQWQYINSFGYRVALGDLDGDGMQEIIGAAGWYKITVFDADIKTPSWEIAADLDIDSLLIVDVDDDGAPEILYGDGQWGRVYAIDASTRKEKWSLSNPEHGVQGLAYGDVDKDGKKEILWSGGGSSTGSDHLFIADPLTGTIEWKSVHVDGPLSPVDAGDLDGDGDDEVVMVSYSSNSGYDEGIIHIFDAKTHALEYQEKLGVMDWMGVRSVKIGDVDGDGKNEFVLNTAKLYDGIIRVYDGATRTVKYETTGYSDSFTAIAIADVDNDGKMEIIAGQGAYLIVFEGATLQEKWRSVALGSYWGYVHDIKINDIDGDGNQEILASLGSQLVVYDGVTHVQDYLSNTPAQALEVTAIEGEGKKILIGRSDGRIDVINAATYTLEKTVNTSNSSSVDALRVVDLNGDGTVEWLVAQNGFLKVLEGKSLVVNWTSPNLSGNLGLFNHLVVRDTDGDGKNEVFIGSNVALYQFE